jgi:hypothetical protein
MLFINWISFNPMTFIKVVHVIRIILKLITGTTIEVLFEVNFDCS